LKGKGIVRRCVHHVFVFCNVDLHKQCCVCCIICLVKEIEQTENIVIHKKLMGLNSGMSSESESSLEQRTVPAPKRFKYPIYCCETPEEIPSTKATPTTSISSNSFTWRAYLGILPYQGMEHTDPAQR
jgi:hypothetical protein